MPAAKCEDQRVKPPNVDAEGRDHLAVRLARADLDADARAADQPA